MVICVLWKVPRLDCWEPSLPECTCGLLCTHQVQPPQTGVVLGLTAQCQRSGPALHPTLLKSLGSEPLHQEASQPSAPTSAGRLLPLPLQYLPFPSKASGVTGTPGGTGRPPSHDTICGSPTPSLPGLREWGAHLGTPRCSPPWGLQAVGLPWSHPPLCQDRSALSLQPPRASLSLSLSPHVAPHLVPTCACSPFPETSGDGFSLYSM